MFSFSSAPMGGAGREEVLVGRMYKGGELA